MDTVNIVEYWQAQFIRNKRTYKTLKKRTLLFFFFQLLLFGYWISGLGSIQLPDNLVFLVIVVLFPIIPVALIFFYTNYHLNKFDSFFEKGRFVNISVNLPGELKTIQKEIITQFKISENTLEWWVDLNLSPNVFVHGFSGMNHVVISLGYLKLLASEPGNAKAILAHELAHVRQEDPEHLIESKIFLKGVILFYLPFVLLLSGSMVMSMLNHRTYLSRGIDTRFVSSLYARPHNPELINNYFLLDRLANQKIYEEGLDVVRLLTGVIIFLISIASIKRFAVKAETAADLGASLICGTGDVAESMKKYSRSVSRIRNLFGVNPSIKLRVRALNRLKEQFPDLPEMGGVAMDQLQTLQPMGFNTSPGRQFSNIPYNSRFRSNWQVDIHVREKKFLKLILFFLIPVLFVIRYAELYFGAFSDYDKYNLIFFYINLLFSLSAIATGMQLVRKSANLIGYIFFLSVIILFSAAVTISEYYTNEGLVKMSFYTFNYKLEHGLIFADMGWLVILIALLLIINLLFVYRTSSAAAKKNFTYFAFVLFIGLISVLWFALATFPQRNPDLVKVIQVASFETGVAIISIDSKYVYLNVGKKEADQEVYKLENSKSLFAGRRTAGMTVTHDSAGYFQKADLLELSDLTYVEQGFLEKYHSGLYTTGCKYARSSKGRYLIVITDFLNDQLEILGEITDDYNAATIKEIDDRREYIPYWQKNRSAYFSYDEKFIITDGGDGEIKIFKIEQ